MILMKKKKKNQGFVHLKCLQSLPLQFLFFENELLKKKSRVNLWLLFQVSFKSNYD